MGDDAQTLRAAQAISWHRRMRGFEPLDVCGAVCGVGHNYLLRARPILYGSEDHAWCTGSYATHTARDGRVMYAAFTARDLVNADESSDWQPGSAPLPSDGRWFVHLYAGWAGSVPNRPGYGLGPLAVREVVGSLPEQFPTWACEALDALYASYVREP